MVITACLGCQSRCSHVAREGAENYPLYGPPDCHSKPSLSGRVGRRSFPNLACDDPVKSCQTGPLEHSQSWNLNILLGVVTIYSPGFSLVSFLPFSPAL